MPFKLLFFLVALTSLLQAQTNHPPAESKALRARVEASPMLAFHATRISPRASTANWQVGPVSSVAVAEGGEIYLIQRGKQAAPILVLDRTGRVLRSWGFGDFTIPHTIRIDPSGNIWTVDAASSSIIEYSALGKTLLKIDVGEQPQNEGPFKGATDIAFAKNGHLFITDGYGNARVLEYSASGKRLRQWGKPGFGPGDFNLPHAIQIDDSGAIYIADRENGRIEEFDIHGNYTGVIPHLGRIYSIKLSGNTIWATMEPFNQDPGSGNGWLVKLDKKTGKILGHLNVAETRAGHSIDITPNGEPIITAGSELLWFEANKP